MLQLWLVANTVLWTFGIKLAGITLSLNVIVLALCGAAWLWKSGKVTVTSARALISFFLVAVFSSVAMLAGPFTSHMMKSILTLPILMAMIFLGLEVGGRAQRSDWLKLQTTALWVIGATFASLIVELMMPGWFPGKDDYRAQGELSGFFSEPSHVAVAMMPCVAILLVAEKRKTRRIGMAVLACLLILSRTTTLLAFVLAWILYRRFLERKLGSALLLVIVAGSIIALNSTVSNSTVLTPILTRILGIGQVNTTSNISSLVYVQGWQDTWSNLRSTRGLGLGLNMMGYSPLPDVSARNILAWWGMGDLNAQDGSFLFAKVVSETGIAGIVFYLAALWWWLRMARKTHLHRDNENYSVAAIQTALIFCFMAESLVRSSGYFGGGLLLFVAAASGGSKWQKFQSMETTTGYKVPPGLLISNTPNG